MKIGVFVGSFNPVHKGHIKIANYLINNGYVDKALFVPTGSYWNKKNIDIKDRIKMLEEYENENIIIEKELNNTKYTYQLMRYLKKKYQNNNLSLVIGADNIISFDKWKNYQELLEMEIFIYKRDNINIKNYLDKLNKKDKYIILDNAKEINISSTKAKDLIKTNNISELKKYLDIPVIKYIYKNNLYK